MLAAVSLAAGCGDGADSTAVPGVSPAPTVASPGLASPSPTSSGSVPAESSQTSPAYAFPPGEEIDPPFVPGADLSVVGVAHDDVLNVRALPTVDAPVVATRGPTDDGVVVSGRGWLVPGASWFEVTVDGTRGWTVGRFLGGRAGTDDVTAALVARIGRPVAPDMAVLGRLVAEASASTDPPSSVVMSVAPSVGDLGEVTYDVVGLGDDSVWAVRLHVFGEPVPDGFALRTVEQTVFCGRGGPTGGDPCP